MFQKIAHLAPSVFSFCEKARKNGSSNLAIQQQIPLKDRLADIFPPPQEVQSLTSSEASSFRIRQSMPLPSGITTLSSYPRARERMKTRFNLAESTLNQAKRRGNMS
ncbi:MAG: hypothetical protein ACKVOS_01975 [Sphingorhabdus sp.]|uniref:hypothetical protein n=1 Tax=Sphingorhabdus sp. TaxID=1902408 RepID=UPI0038FBE817